MNESINILSNVSHEIPWGNIVVVISFFISLSVGAFFVSSLSTVFRKDKYKALSKTGAIIALVTVVIALLLLILHLGRPLRFFHLMFMFNFSSPITWGTFLLGLYLINLLVYFRFLVKEDPRIRIVGIMGIVLAVGVVFYQGLKFGIVEARPLWNTAIMPVYFLVSALLLGPALLILTSVVKKTDKETRNGLGRMLTAFIVVEFCVAFLHILTAYNSGKEAAAAAGLLLSCPLFIWVGILLGLVFPLMCLLLPKMREKFGGQSIASLLVLIGVYAVRYSIVILGQTILLS